MMFIMISITNEAHVTKFLSHLVLRSSQLSIKLHMCHMFHPINLPFHSKRTECVFNWVLLAAIYVCTYIANVLHYKIHDTQYISLAHNAWQSTAKALRSEWLAGNASSSLVCQPSHATHATNAACESPPQAHAVVTMGRKLLVLGMEKLIRRNLAKVVNNAAKHRKCNCNHLERLFLP